MNHIQGEDLMNSLQGGRRQKAKGGVTSKVILRQPKQKARGAVTAPFQCESRMCGGVACAGGMANMKNGPLRFEMSSKYS